MDVDVVDGELCNLSISPVQLVLGDPVEDDQASGVANDSEQEKHECASKELRNVCDYSAKELRDSESGPSNVQDTLEIAVPPRDLAGAAMTLCCGTGQPEVEAVKNEPKVQRQETAQPKPSEGCLLRLFESQVFDMSMAISYLFNSKEPGVQSYLGELWILVYQYFSPMCKLNVAFI
jgi:hypothetical protein